MERQKVKVIFKGFEEAVEPQHDEIYFNGATHSFLQSSLIDEFLWPVGEMFDYTVLLWHNEYELDSIRFFDADGREFEPNDLAFKDFDRSYKDYYWYYSRNQDYWREINFVMPDYPIVVEINYVRSRETTVLRVDPSSLGDLLYHGNERLCQSFLYCYEETANHSRHYFKEGDIYFYPVGSSLTFSISLLEKREVGLKIGDTLYRPSEVLDDESDDVQVYRYVFGSLDEMDDDIIASKKGHPIRINAIEAEACFCLFE